MPDMTIITTTRKLVTLINVFTVEPAMRENPGPLPYLRQALEIAKFDPGMYEVIETFSGGAPEPWKCSAGHQGIHVGLHALIVLIRPASAGFHFAGVLLARESLCFAFSRGLSRARFEFQGE